MSRLIDADALIEAVKDFPYGYRGMIVCTIAEQPTIEPEDRCSECDAWNKYKNYSQPERKKGAACSSSSRVRVFLGAIYESASSIDAVSLA